MSLQICKWYEQYLEVSDFHSWRNLASKYFFCKLTKWFLIHDISDELIAPYSIFFTDLYREENRNSVDRSDLLFDCQMSVKPYRLEQIEMLFIGESHKWRHWDLLEFGFWMLVSKKNNNNHILLIQNEMKTYPIKRRNRIIGVLRSRHCYSTAWTGGWHLYIRNVRWKIVESSRKSLKLEVGVIR